MRVFRLSRKIYADDLSGKGAAKFGNRWNSKGMEMVYSAQSRALAMAEVLVHLSLEDLPEDYMMVELNFPDTLEIEELLLKELKADWNVHPPKSFTRKIGDVFIDNKRACVLKVPSAVVKGDFNYLINPNHSEIKKIKVVEIVEFPFDRRMFK
ncbi:RES family NAD+ phosphorylase [Aequorivita sp. SDUM287046]|uniref:RES family NAD+ phosphorylase n=1 Tax=Aequorivita aurantiaca TaxID=3053356 RepID=A0ABT8DJL6_9FLAO|nr:RES family NAD+ phosphorylase [Aequorivita aurantiaca]MDN3725233.1 RES family NAD+ phosphorylase [Aequorivita aurantiaca]